MLISGNSFTIRDINQDDLDEVLDAYHQCEDFLALGPEPTASMSMVLKDIEISQREGGVFCSVRNANGKMIGVVDFVPSNFQVDSSTAFFSLMMIATSFRKHGIGTKIVELVEKEIGKGSQVAIILSAVQVNNPDALRFWQKIGYRIIEEPETQPDKTTVFRVRKDCK